MVKHRMNRVTSTWTDVMVKHRMNRVTSNWTDIMVKHRMNRVTSTWTDIMVKHRMNRVTSTWTDVMVKYRTDVMVKDHMMYRVIFTRCKNFFLMCQLFVIFYYCIFCKDIQAFETYSN
jgi:hypothetical protein